LVLQLVPVRFEIEEIHVVQRKDAFQRLRLVVLFG
jgi:hypothetical protein